MTPTPPAPVPDLDSAPYWAALREHRLELQRCDDCGTWRWIPRALCSACGSFAATWTPTSGRGTVASWIVNHHPFGPAYPTPYIVAEIRLDEAPDLLLPGGWAAEADDLAIDRPVEALFIDHHPAEGNPFTLLAWHPRPT